MIESEEVYEAVLGRVAELMDAEPGSSSSDEPERLAGLVEQYERERFPFVPLLPADP